MRNRLLRGVEQHERGVFAPIGYVRRRQLDPTAVVHSSSTCSTTGRRVSSLQPHPLGCGVNRPPPRTTEWVPASTVDHHRYRRTRAERRDPIAGRAKPGPAAVSEWKVLRDRSRPITGPVSGQPGRLKANDARGGAAGWPSMIGLLIRCLSPLWCLGTQTSELVSPPSAPASTRIPTPPDGLVSWGPPHRTTRIADMTDHPSPEASAPAANLVAGRVDRDGRPAPEPTRSRRLPRRFSLGQVSRRTGATSYPGPHLVRTLNEPGRGAWGRVPARQGVALAGSRLKVVLSGPTPGLPQRFLRRRPPPPEPSVSSGPRGGEYAAGRSRPGTLRGGSLADRLAARPPGGGRARGGMARSQAAHEPESST